jgi:hypothetical protein
VGTDTRGNSILASPNTTGWQEPGPPKLAECDKPIWGAELASGGGQERIYVVETTGPIVDDPNLTDKKFSGNPTLSYRSRDPLRVIAEVTNWQGHSPERLRQMKDGLARLKSDDAGIID